MKHRTRILLLTPLFLFTFFGFARDPECRTINMNIGPTFNFARYNFDCQPKYQGYLAGVHADFEHVMLNREYVGVRFDGRWNAGTVSGCNQTSEIKDYRTELNLGYNVSRCGINRFTPFLGLGFYYLADEFGSGNSSCCINNFGGENCTLRYYNLFVPIGFKAEWQKTDCFSWGLNAEYRIDAWTRLRQGESSSSSCCQSWSSSCNQSCSSSCGGCSSSCSSSCNNSCDKIKLQNRTQGFLIEVPLTWRRLAQCGSTDIQIKVVPLFDWNRFGAIDSCCSSSSSSCGSCSSSCNSCSSGCSSSSSCSSNGRVITACEPILCPLYGCESGPCGNTTRLTQWYLGLHVDLGIRF